MYDLVYADPPWRQTKGGRRSVRPKQGRSLDYRVMSLKDIHLTLARFPSRILFIWTIDKFLFEAQKISESFGHKLHARIIWNKTNGVAPAFTVRFSHEYLLWFYTSPMLTIDPNFRGKFTTVITEKATKHSKKPEAAYRMIEALYPNAHKIELFARNLREGWESWGDEI